MKIAVLSDIHANFVALQAVSDEIDRWRADHVFVAGDIINRGPRPALCLKFILDKAKKDGWKIIRGNHEDYVSSWKNPRKWKFGYAAQVHQASKWTYQKIGSDTTTIDRLAYQYSIWDDDNKEVRIVHASMLGNRDGIYPETTKIELASKTGLNTTFPKLAVICCGHTHRPLIRNLFGASVVNVGSAGLPFDGDTRPSYAQLTFSNHQWQGRIVRVEYCLEAAIRDFHISGYLADAGPLSKIVLVELKEARSLLYYWAKKYQSRAMSGSISMRESVDEFIFGMNLQS